MITNASLLQRFRFFQEHAGGIVGENAKGALQLARAEIALEDARVDVLWSPDDDADFSFADTWTARERAKWDATDHTAEDARIVIPCREHGPHCPHSQTLASMGGIVDADNDYRRVINAELALEAFDELRALAV